MRYRIGQALAGFILGATILGATAATVGNSNLDPNDFTVTAGGIQPATGSTPPLMSLTQTGVVSGTYNNPTLDITSTGRITRAVSGSTGGVTSVNGKSGAVNLTLPSSDFANEGTTTTVLHGNAAGNPSFSSVNLATDVVGNLSTGNLNSGVGASATTAWCGNGTWCTPSSGSGTVNSGTAGNVAWYAGTGTAIDGNQVANLAQGKLTLGVAASTIGQLALAGNTSGTVTVTPVAATSNWTLTLPSTSGINGQFLSTDGSGTSSWQSTGNSAQAITRQLFTSGGGATYTTPANATQLRVLECAGGGGSGGLGAGAGTGGTGGTTTFNSVTAIGGSGGTGTTTTTGGVGGVGGTGGVGSLGTGGIRIKGGDGSDGGNVVGAIAQVAGGVGGVTRIGGFQSASASNNGAGADGDNSASVLTGGSGAGGGGECAEIIITTPVPTYTYTVGTFGAAGAGATAGLAGNPGAIIVDEYYGATTMALTNHQVLLGTGSGIGTVAGTGTVNQVLTSSGAGIDPVWANPPVGTVTSIATGTGLQGGTITSSGTLSLANTTVVAGSYTNTNLTVDAQGRLTAASTGSAGAGTVNAATAGNVAWYATTGSAVSGNQVANITQGTLTLGVAASTVGKLVLAGNSSGNVTLAPTAAAGSWTLTLPSTSGANAAFLQTDGSGITSWVAPAPIPPAGRLTLQSGAPIMTTDQSTKSTVFYDSYIGNTVPVWNGTAWVSLTITNNEISMGLDSVTPHIASGSVYDILGVLSGGTLNMCTGPAWTNTTSRGTGAGSTNIHQLNGIWTNTNSITNCWGGPTGIATAGTIQPSQGTYLGSLYAVSNGNTSMVISPTKLSGGTNNFVALYNGYNRVRIVSTEIDGTTSWAGAANSVWRPANNKTANRITVLDGLQQSNIVARFKNMLGPTAGGSTTFGIGIDLDSTSNAPNSYAGFFGTVGGAAEPTAFDSYTPQIGLHFLQAMEISVGAGTFFANEGGPTRNEYRFEVELED